MEPEQYFEYRRLWDYYRFTLDVDVPDMPFYDVANTLTREQWEAFNWVSDTITKPSFEDALEYTFYAKLQKQVGTLRTWTGRLDYIKQGVLKDTATISIEDRNVHRGGGLGQMTGLLQMVEQANTAGAYLPRIHLRGDRHDHRYHTQAEIRKILEETAKSENVIESAHNIILGRFLAWDLKWKDTTLPKEARENAATEARNIINTYETLLKAEMERFDPDAMPIGLFDLKDVLIERLEATALKQVKYLRGVVTQQGIDLPANCPEAAEAEMLIASFRYKGALLITEAVDATQAKNYAEQYKTNIRNVSVSNSPVFSLRGQRVPLQSVYTAPQAGGSLALTLRQDTRQPKQVLQVGILSGDATIKNVRKQAHQLDFTLEIEVNKKVTVELIARNICGPTKLTIQLN